MSTKVVKPNFIIIGAAKSATSSLASLLRQHPDADIVKGKEPHFFSYNKQYSLGWQFYLSLYNHCKENVIAYGDASTSYSRIRYYPNVIQRIKHHVPDAKIIFMVRHPIDRIESAYVQYLGYQVKKLGGRDAMKNNSISEAVIRQPMMVDSSRYWEVFDAYRQHFPEENIKIVWFDEYINNREEVYQDICHFLNIRENIPNFMSLKEKTNNRSLMINYIKKVGRSDVSIDTELDPIVRQKIVNTLRVDNLRFLEYFEKPVDYWGDLFK